MSLQITQKYIDWKEEELTLAFEYQQKKQEEKEAQKAARAEMREAARLQKEIEAQRKKIEKEQTHYQTAYEKLLKQLEEDPDNSDLLAKNPNWKISSMTSIGLLKISTIEKQTNAPDTFT